MSSRSRSASTSGRRTPGEVTARDALEIGAAALDPENAHGPAEEIGLGELDRRVAAAPDRERRLGADPARHLHELVDEIAPAQGLVLVAALHGAARSSSLRAGDAGHSRRADRDGTSSSPTRRTGRRPATRRWSAPAARQAPTATARWKYTPRPRIPVPPPSRAASPTRDAGASRSGRLRARAHPTIPHRRRDAPAAAPSIRHGSLRNLGRVDHRPGCQCGSSSGTLSHDTMAASAR